MINSKTIRQKINEIEEEMKKIGMWQKGSLSEDAYKFEAAFGSDKMSLPQWLQFIFLPKVHELLETDGPWPTDSQIGIYAAQQFMFFRPVDGEDGVLETQGSSDSKEQKLVGLLNEFDQLFKQ